MTSDLCKICGGSELALIGHTARCQRCGVLLYWPYPAALPHSQSSDPAPNWSRDSVRDWYAKSSFRNHDNFTHMLRFATDESYTNRPIDVLDYGGGGGQFALVCRSHFPMANVHITDINDDVLLDEWRCVNTQIPFANLSEDTRRFDLIFLNDVFEHVDDPISVLRLLGTRLKPGGRLFIDTPKQFWLYPTLKLLARPLYLKLLRGTVSTAHLQIWSQESFRRAIEASGLHISKYAEVSEYTMPADYYLNNMGIANPLIRVLGRLFYANARYLARNKILCLLAART